MEAAVVFSILLGLLVVPSAYTSVPVTEFLAYGLANGDSQLPIADDNFINVPLQQGSVFNFFKSSYNSLFVNNNGAISFTQGVPQYTPSCGPISVPMIIPFWADVDTTNGGKVYYRETTDPHFLLKASEGIHLAFPSLNNINLRWAFIVTWDDVAFFGAVNNCGGQTKRNTFQAILTSDGSKSFVIFFYNKVTWTTGTASSGSCTGLGGSPAKAGFDTGDGKTFFEIGGTCTDAIVNIETTTNVGQPGKWIFRTDNELQSPECNAASAQLSISPSFMSMFGNNPITVKCNCITGATAVQCRFNDKRPKTVNAVVSTNVATCNVPYLYKNGRIKVDLLVTRNGTVETFSGYIYTVQPTNQVHFQLVNASEFTMSWDKTFFGRGTTHLLDLELVELAGGVWTSRGVIKENVLNAGSFSGSLNSQGVAAIGALRSIHIVKLAPSPPLGRSLISGILYSLRGKTEAEVNELCNIWYLQDRKEPTDALACPRTLVQASMDERFEAVDDLSIYNPGAQQGYRQRVPSPSGAGQRCVYKNGQILVGPPSGGNVRSVSPNSDFIGYATDDILPWYTCCHYTTNLTSCSRYYERRPSSSGQGYDRMAITQSIGDPHITTFDGLYYTFLGVGEFWMIKSDNFSMQTRTTALGAASVSTAFVMQQRTCQDNFVTIEVSQTLNGIEIILDGEVVALDPKQPKRTIMHNGASIAIFSRKDVRVTFSSGFTFSFTDTPFVLNLLGTVSMELKGKIKGLLGFFDGNLHNDLTLPNDAIASPGAAHDFGMQWKVNAENSLFTYPPCKSFYDYQYVNFVPTYELPANIPPQALIDCNGSKACLFDLLITGNADLASSTLEADKKFNLTREALGICDILVDQDEYYIQDSGGRYVHVDRSRQYPLGFTSNIPICQATKFRAYRKSCNVFGFCAPNACMGVCVGCKNDLKDGNPVTFHVGNTNVPEWTHWKLEKQDDGLYTLYLSGYLAGFLTVRQAPNGRIQLTRSGGISNFRFIRADSTSC